MMLMKPGTKSWKKRIDTWAKRMQNTNNGEKSSEGQSQDNLDKLHVEEMT